MGQSTEIKFGEAELFALNVRADLLSQRYANDWDEAVDWGVPDWSNLRVAEWRAASSPDFD